MPVREINWRKFHQKPKLHIKEVRSAELIAYDANGRIYSGPDIGIDPSIDLPLIIWAKVDFVPWAFLPIEFGMKHDAYVFGWTDKRLSCLPRHKYYFRGRLWLTIADRDFVFKALTRGMFES